MISPSVNPLASGKIWNISAPYPWVSDQGDGTYQNPVLHADYSDPDVIRHGDDFYMTTSSFNCTPGLPILHSRDMVNWALINHAVPQLPHPRFYSVQPGQGIWAPSLRFHDGKFWIFFAMPDEGIYFVTANDPAGVWSAPHLVQAGRGLIDPCPLWDDDGKAYLVHAYAGSRAGIKHRLRVCPMASDGSRLLGEGKVVFHEPERHPTLEGPKFLKKDGWYYILAPAGGVATGWQTVLRAREVYGPYKDRTVMLQGPTPVNGPHQGALVELPNDMWWFFHFQDAGIYGRIVHLQPVTWIDGWPVMGSDSTGAGIGFPVPNHRKPDIKGRHPLANPGTSDEFNALKLELQWQWHSNSLAEWYSLSERPGYLRLFSQHTEQGDLARAGHLLLQKFPATAFTVETWIEFNPKLPGESAGLTVMGLKHAAVALRKSTKKDGYRVVYLINNIERDVSEVECSTVLLRLHVEEGGVCTFGFCASPDGPERLFAEHFHAKKGKWIGAKVGLFALSPVAGKAGHADFDYFRFLPLARHEE